MLTNDNEIYYVDTSKLLRYTQTQPRVVVCTMLLLQMLMGVMILQAFLLVNQPYYLYQQ